LHNPFFLLLRFDRAFYDCFTIDILSFLSKTMILQKQGQSPGAKNSLCVFIYSLLKDFFKLNDCFSVSVLLVLFYHRRKGTKKM